MTEYQLNKFERYLCGEMEKEELENFDLEMQQSEELQTKFFSFRTALQELATEEEASVSIPLQEAENRKETNPINQKGRIIPLKKVLSIAASLIILLGCFWYFLSPSGNTKLLTELNPIELPLPEVYSKSAGNNTINNNLKEELSKELEKKNWQAVINLTRPILSKNNLNDAANILHLHLGYAYYKLEKFDLAIQNLDLAQERVSEDKLYKGPKELALYYKALSLIGNDEKEAAINILNQINQSETNKKIKTTSNNLLNKIKQIR